MAEKKPNSISGQSAVKNRSASPASNGFTITFAATRSSLARVGNRLQQAIAAVHTTPPGWKQLLIAVVLAGIGISAIRLLLSLFAIGRLYRKSTPLADSDALKLITRLKRRSGFRGPIELRETDELTSAATFGFFQSVILLPLSWRDWTSEELFSVLAHEVAHICRGDYRQRLLARLCATIYFYHPLIRWCVRGLAVDQEFAADGLARSLGSDPKDYLRGLAKLALRYDGSFPDGNAWSNVSIMPKSSDFLARRLEMLRTKNGSVSKQTGRLVSYLASASVILVALLATLLRGASPQADQTATDAREPVRTAKLNADPSDKVPISPPASDRLFARAPFDPSLIPHAEKGAYLIRVKDLLRNPDLRKQIEKLNELVSMTLSVNLGNNGTGDQEQKNTEDLATKFKVDMQQVEWIAGPMCLSFGMTKNSNDGDLATMMLGTESVVIRMAESNDWQKLVLENVPGATLETFEGQAYVQLPVFPWFGPIGARLRFPDDRTIVGGGGSKPEVSAQSLKSFFSDRHGQQPYSWADVWHAMDGGVVTVVTDFSASGWSKLTPEKQQERPEYAAPFFEEVKYYGVGIDLADSGERIGMQVRGNLPNNSAMQAVHLASMILLNKWPAVYLENEENFEKFHKRILQFIADIKIEPSKPESDQHYIQASAEPTINPEEILGLLQMISEAGDP